MKKILLILFIVLTAPNLFCQQTDDSVVFVPNYKHGIKYIVKTNANTIFKGFVINETKDFVTLENRDVHETYELRKSEIVQAKLYTDPQTYADLVLGENYHARNYLLAQSAFLFRAEKASTTTHLLVLNNIDYAITENWAVTANTLAFFYPIALGVKCAYAIDNLNYIGANAFGIGIRGSGGPNSGLYGYGAMGKFTRGTSNTNFTVFGGVLGLNSDILAASPTRAFVNTGFMGVAYCKRTSKRLAINAEGWYLPQVSLGLAGFGLKLVGDENICWSFGCYTFLSQYNNTLQVNLKVLPLPYIGITRNFN